MKNTESFLTVELGNRNLEINDGKQANGTSKNSTLENSDALQTKLVQNEKQMVSIVHNNRWDARQSELP